MNKIVQWWIIVVASALGLGVCIYSGLLGTIWKADITKISFLTMAVFWGFSILVGAETVFVSHDNKPRERRMELYWFMSDTCLTLGLLGTVIGIVYTVGGAFTNIKPQDPATMTAAIKLISTGFGTALYTTAVGLVTGLLLKLELINIETS